MSEQEIKLGYLKQRPQTNLEQLRAALDQLDKLVGSLRYLDAQEAGTIPELFDQVQAGFRLVESSGMELKGERAQWEMSCQNFIKQAGSYIRVVGGREALAALREPHDPALEAWWWYPERLLDEQRKSQGLRLIFWAGLAVVLLASAALLYQRYLAPDEATQASLQHGFEAENLAQRGDYQAAYDEIELAIAAKPGQADLYLLKGVLAELLGKPETALQAYQMAEAASPDRVTYLIARANEYLRFALPDKAIVDAQAALTLDSRLAAAYLILGQAYESSGDFQGALDHYRQADVLATEQDDAQLQVLARMSIAQLYNKLPVVAPTKEATLTPQGDGN